MSKSPDRHPRGGRACPSCLTVSRACSQVDTTTQLAAGEKHELLEKVLAVARAHRGYVRPSDDCVLAKCHGITADDLLAL